MTRTFAAVLVAGIALAAVPAASAQDNHGDAQPAIQIAAPAPASRPAILPPLYAGLAALQVYDGYSTIRGVREGERETNPLVEGLAERPVVLWSLKAATTALSIYFAEQQWRQHHRTQAIVTMIVANGVMAAAAARNASRLSSRR